MKKLDCAVIVLLLIAAINCGIFGIFHVNILGAFLESPVAERIAYTTFGLSAIYIVVYFRAVKKRWTQQP